MKRKPRRTRAQRFQDIIARAPRRVTGPDGDNPITDDQILELGEDPRSSITTKAWCIAAMRVTYGAGKRQLAERDDARCVCAGLWNARHGAKP